MIVKFPDGSQVQVGGVIQKMESTSGGGATIVFSDLVGGSAFTFTCFSNKEQADMIAAVEAGLASGLSFLNLSSQSPLPAKGSFVFTPNPSPQFTAVMITLSTAASPLVECFLPDCLVTFAGQLASQIRYVNATTLNVVLPLHAAGAVDVIYRDQRGSVTVAAGDGNHFSYS